MSVIHEFKVRMTSDAPSDNPNYIADMINAAIKFYNNEEGISDHEDPFILQGIDVAFVCDKPLSSPKWPCDLTDDQKSALWRKWRLDNNELTFQEFVDGVNVTSGMEGAVTVRWCNMWLAIETNGYTHT